MSTEAPPQTSTPTRPPTQWIVSARFDGFFFIGSCVLTLLFLGGYLLAREMALLPEPQTIIITYFIYSALLDQPHIFQTFSRTHLDPEEFARRRGLYTWGVAGFIFVGWVVVAAGLKGYLIVFAAIYGSWHIIRQHSGFLKAYKGLNNDTEPIDNVLDASLFYVGLFAFVIHDYRDLHGPVAIFGDQTAPFPSVPGWLSVSLINLFWILLVLFFLRQLQRLVRGEGLNWPKLLLLTAIISTRYVVFYAAAIPFLVAEAVETAYHDVQYHGWMTHYQKRRAGLPRVVVTHWFTLAMGYGLLVSVVELFDLVNNDGFWQYVFAPFTMLVIFHYYIDGKIWRFSDYPRLRQELFARERSQG